MTLGLSGSVWRTRVQKLRTLSRNGRLRGSKKPRKYKCCSANTWEHVRMKTRHIDQIRFKKLVPVPQHHCMLSVTNGQIPVLRLVKPNRSCHGQSSWSRLSAHLHTEGARSSRSCLGSFCCLVSAWRQSFLQHLWECDEVRREDSTCRGGGRGFAFSKWSEQAEHSLGGAGYHKVAESDGLGHRGQLRSLI